MTLLLNSLILLFGLFLLGFSADVLVKASIKLATLLRLSVLFISVILVAFGTSLPEAAVSIAAAVQNRPEIALGNVVGSNIANLGLVLGVLGLVMPVPVPAQVFRQEIPIMLAATVGLWLACADGVLGRFDGFLFIVGFLAFCYFSYQGAQDVHEEIEEETSHGFIGKTKSKAKIAGVLVLALTLLCVASNIMVTAGVNIAEILGVKPWIIAITLFAVGTSLPELATCLTAARRKVAVMSIGNIVGSNIFNILFVLGLVTLWRPIRIDVSQLRLEFPVLMILTFAAAIFMRDRYLITRWKAFLLLSSYVVFMIMLFTSGDIHV